jgi:hypothetical protein
VGYVELDENDCVWFVFPERPDEAGEPRRLHWGEATANDEFLRLMVERTDRQRLPVTQTA